MQPKLLTGSLTRTPVPFKQQQITCKCFFGHRKEWKVAKQLPELDPLIFLPIRYEDLRVPVNSAEFEEGIKVLVAGRIMSMDIFSGGRSPVMNVWLEDESGPFQVRFLCVTPFCRKVFSMIRRKVFLWGAPKKEKDGWVFYHPGLPKEVGRIFPVYQCPKGISMQRLRDHVWQLTQALLRSLKDDLPREMREMYGLPELPVALRQIHKPEGALPGRAELECVALAAARFKKGVPAASSF
ncbi:MAG: hypothetical protein C0402_05395 [Thermodesulfovibrio sp.]|nr:hypothetical protein [Thermodesulfovibrio sp.]